jgi:hypothetical protein
MQLKAQDRADLRKLARTSPDLAKKIMAGLKKKKTAATAFDAYDAAIELDKLFAPISAKMKALENVAYQAGDDFDKQVGAISSLFTKLDDLVDRLATFAKKQG